MFFVKLFFVLMIMFLYWTVCSFLKLYFVLTVYLCSSSVFFLSSILFLAFYAMFIDIMFFWSSITYVLKLFYMFFFLELYSLEGAARLTTSLS